MYSVLGVGGHLLSDEIGELLYTFFRYLRKRQMMADIEVTGGQLIAAEISPIKRNIVIWEIYLVSNNDYHKS